MKIQVKLAPANKVNGINSAFISFPYSTDLLNVIRSISPRWWHADKKLWEISNKDLQKFTSQANGAEIIIDRSEFVTPVEVAPVSPANYKFKTAPFTHQIEGFNYGMKKAAFLLGDEQGLGKTKQAIDIAVAKKQQLGYKHCLVICGVNGLKWNWQVEIATHSDEQGYLLGTRYNKTGKQIIGSVQDRLDDLDSLPDAYFIITNIETLRGLSVNEGTTKKKKMVYPVANKIDELCKANKIDMIIFDELHHCKDSTSQQGESLLKIHAKSQIAMTGTPLMNTPMDLFMPLKWLGIERHSFWQFKNHYCVMGGYGGHEVVGYKNMAELRESLSDNMLRRLKSEALDLPPKIHSTEYVEMEAKQTQVYDMVLGELRSEIDKIKMSNNPLSQLIRLRQASGYTGILSSKIQESAKLDRLEEMVEEITSTGGKIIVFSNWTAMTTPAIERLAKYNPAVITGEIVDRQAEQSKFTNDPSCKVIIGTIGAMGTGLTLTAASTVIFLDSPWNRANKEQAEDRAHRIGTKSTVNIITLVCKDTIDARIEELIYKKGVMADIMVDGAKISGDKEAISDLIDSLLR